MLETLDDDAGHNNWMPARTLISDNALFSAGVCRPTTNRNGGKLSAASENQK
jgi:hypothetical protein